MITRFCRVHRRKINKLALAKRTRQSLVTDFNKIVGVYNIHSDIYYIETTESEFVIKTV